MSRAVRHNLWALCAIVAATVAAMHVLRLPRIVVDDAFISYRYALNLAEGRGLVFNAGEYVEGFSNLAWVLLTTLGMKLGADPVPWTRALGAAALILTVIASARLAWRCTRSAAATIACALLLATSTAFCSSAVSGLETGLYALCVTAALVAVSERRFVIASICFAVAGLTRTEGFALPIVAIVMWLCPSGARARRNRWSCLQLAGPAVATLLATVAFRGAYYGAMVPNSVTAKSNMLPLLMERGPREMVPTLLNEPGLQYVGQFLLATLGAAAPLMMLPIWFATVRRRSARMLGGVALVGMAIAVYNFGDWMSSFRLLTPYLPPLAVLTCWGGAIAVRRAGESSQPIARPAAAMIVLALITFAVAGGWQHKLPREHFSSDRQFAAILGASQQKDLLAATDVLGRLGYYAPQVRIIDMAGLTDRYIATHGEPKPTIGKWAPDYVLAQRPHFLMTNTLAAWGPTLRRADVNDEYVWLDAPAWRGECGGPPRFVFVRRGSVLDAEFAAVYPAARRRAVREAIRATAGEPVAVSDRAGLVVQQ